MTTIDTINEPTRTDSVFGRFVSRLLVILRVIGEEIAYMLHEDGAHGRIERGVDDKY